MNHTDGAAAARFATRADTPKTANLRALRRWRRACWGMAPKTTPAATPALPWTLHLRLRLHQLAEVGGGITLGDPAVTNDEHRAHRANLAREGCLVRILLRHVDRLFVPVVTAAHLRNGHTVRVRLAGLERGQPSVAWIRRRRVRRAAGARASRVGHDREGGGAPGGRLGRGAGHGRGDDRWIVRALGTGHADEQSRKGEVERGARHRQRVYSARRPRCES